MLTLFSDFKIHFSVRLSTRHFLTQKEKCTKVEMQAQASGIMQSVKGFALFGLFKGRVDNSTRDK
jgi:hypothetical protein